MSNVASVIERVQESISLTTIIYTVVAGIILSVGYSFPFGLVIRQLVTPLRLLPGPPSPHFFWGWAKEIFRVDHSVLQEQWMKEYGPTLAYRGMFGTYRLWTMDTRALNHVLTNSYNYQKPKQSRTHLARVVGPGVLVTEEDQHHNQRRILNPAFGPGHIRELTEIFVEKSQALRDAWLVQIAQSGTDQANIDAMSWLSKTTLDIIGLAGFNYNFDALSPDGRKNELSEAFHTVFTNTGHPRFLGILQGFFPLLRLIRTEAARKSDEAQATMRRIGLQLLAEKRAAILAASGNNNVEKKHVLGRDLLTLLIKANLATDIPDSQRLTDDEVLAQVPTFIVAGHETTSTATTWALHGLTQHPEIQKKLRDELLSVPTENPSMDELQALPYLEMFVREVLRHYSPVPMTIRQATKADLIPLNTPFVDRNGQTQDHIRVAEGDFVVIPILSINRYKPLWGEDAMEFKPERWENIPDAVNAIPGVYGNVLSFLGGPRSCIGYRFSLIEMKSLLFTLVRSFEYSLAVPAESIRPRSSIVQRPVVTGDGKEEGRLPLIVKPYVRA
ncbi:cytochrome P450 [Trametopsis cervina]|nr:cytochrome P450 [Trametopsis cervina]